MKIKDLEAISHHVINEMAASKAARAVLKPARPNSLEFAEALAQDTSLVNKAKQAVHNAA